MKVLSLLSLLILILFLTLMLPCCFWQQIDPYPESSPTILHKFVKLTQQLDGSSSNPSALWDGDSLAVAFEYKDTDGNCFVYFLRCKPDGTLSVTPKLITKNRTVSFKPKLAGNGDTFGIAYEGEDNGSKKIFFRIIDSSGTLLDDEISVSSNGTKSSDPYCVWSE